MTITAKKETLTEDNNTEDNSAEKYIRRERYYGTIRRAFYVGENVTEEDINAKFDNGILKLFVPKIEVKPVEEEKKIITIEG